jgi:hypothetical protein
MYLGPRIVCAVATYARMLQGSGPFRDYYDIARHDDARRRSGEVLHSEIAYRAIRADTGRDVRDVTMRSALTLPRRSFRDIFILFFVFSFLLRILKVRGSVAAYVPRATSRPSAS